MMRKPKTGFLTVPNGRIYFEHVGAGPAVVLIPSAFLDHRQWDPQFANYSDRRTVVRYDVRGRGRSTGDRSNTLDSEDLDALLDHLAIPRAVIVGNSVGASVAAEFAAAFPERTTGLVLVAGGPPDLEPTPEEEAQFLESFPAGEGRLLERMREGRRAEAIEMILQIWAARIPDSERDRVRQIATDNYDHFMEFRTPSQGGSRSPTFPIASALATAGIPILAITGAHDNPADNMMVRRFASSVPTARHIELASADHTANLSAMAEFDQIVRDFLDRVENGAPWPPRP